MAKRFYWRQDENGAGFRCEMPGEVTLYVGPEKTREFGRKAARGTMWRASVSQWEESTRTMSRYGRDCYRETCKNAATAKVLAESVYDAAIKTIPGVA